ncbi:MAG: acyl-CoA thioesterase [Candidatus Korobacteraceae bacterium]|jgi:acyl-CoA hydrolase
MGQTPGTPGTRVVARAGVEWPLGNEVFKQGKDRLVSTESEKEEQARTRFDALLNPKPVAGSASEMVQYVLPNDANPLGALLGGRLMHWIDLAGALAAHRHSRSYVVTASIDHLDFLVPGRVGDLMILQSSVNRVFRTSLEVGVKVSVEHYLSNERSHVSSAYLTFVAVDRHGRKLQVPPVLPETEDEKRRYDDAGRRREIRQAEKIRKLERLKP